MRCRISELRCKEVINIVTGARYGYVGDVELELEEGVACALIVPGPARFFGLFGRGEDRVFPWECVRRFGDDIILVEQDVPMSSPRRPVGERRRWF